MAKKVGIRYCGGCNPRFDRTAMVKELRKVFPDLFFENAYPGIPYGVVVVVCGCPSCCADVVGLTGERGLMYIKSEQDRDRVQMSSTFFIGMVSRIFK